MIKTLHIHPKVEKILGQMKSVETTPRIAAERAEGIIDALIKGTRPARAGRLSKSKDARIRNLIKFNLGKGFRLISLKDNTDLYILFIGPHDQCDTWLDNNRKKKPHHTEVPMISYEITERDSFPEKYCEPESEYTEESSESHPEVSQEYLRRIFSGLVATETSS